MAVLDKSQKPFIQDRDSNVFIGIDLPFRKSEGVEGYFASTSTTVDAIKTDIKCLLNTRVGERMMQPSLGVELHKYLFEQITPALKDEMKASLLNTFRVWLPFALINDVQIKEEEITT